MAWNHDARSNRNLWASQTIKKTQRKPQEGYLVRSNSSLHAYPAVGYCRVTIQTSTSEDIGNVEISRTVPRVEVPHCDYSLENSVLETVKKMEQLDQEVAENRVKFQKEKKLREEQAQRERLLDIENKKREEEQRKIDEQKAEEKERADKLAHEEKEKNDKLASYASFTGLRGAFNRDANRAMLQNHDWDLNAAIEAYYSNAPGTVPEVNHMPQSNEVKITIYIDGQKHVWTKKASDTIWELYSDVAVSGKNEAFHFVDQSLKKYKEDKFETTLAEAGWVPSVTLTVCKDEA